MPKEIKKTQQNLNQPHMQSCKKDWLSNKFVAAFELTTSPIYLQGCFCKNLFLFFYYTKTTQISKIFAAFSVLSLCVYTEYTDEVVVQSSKNRREKKEII